MTSGQLVLFWKAAQEAANPVDLGHKSVIFYIDLLGR